MQSSRKKASNFGAFLLGELSNAQFSMFNIQRSILIEQLVLLHNGVNDERIATQQVTL
jgi:hypothetical protein